MSDALDGLWMVLGIFSLVAALPLLDQMHQRIKGGFQDAHDNDSGD